MKSYHSLNKFLVRRPSGVLNQFNHILQERDLESTTKRIFDFFQDSFNAHALFLASPNLYEQFQRIKLDEALDFEKHKSLLISLYKYMARMTCRSTPFGTFAGCGVGEIAETSNLQMSQTYTSVRLDMDYLFHLAYHLGKSAALRPYFQYYTNSTLWSCEDSYRFIERKFTNKGYKYIISEVDSNEYLDALVSMGQDAQTIDVLVTYLVEQEIEKEEAIEYINQLIDNQVLIHQLTPSVCGDDFFSKILNFIQPIPHNPIIWIRDKYMELNTLKEIFMRVQKLLIDIAVLDNNASNKLLADLFEQLDLIGVAYQKEKVIQTELFYNDDITADTTWLKRVRKAAEYSTYFSKASTWDLSKLTAFVKKFVDRYEEREVGLLEALDSEVGIGYLQNSSTNYQRPTHDVAITRFLAEKLIRSRGAKVMEIIPEELKQFEKPALKLSDSLSMKTELYQTRGGEDFIHFAGGGFLSTGAGVIARFSYGNDRIDTLASELIRQEEKLRTSDFILAEVDHIPEGRSGNVLSRPTYRKYVINYMTPPATDMGVYSIPLDDLMISVSNGIVFLRSKKLNKFVIPRITSAHNHHFGRTQPVYQLFGDMQFQDSYDSFKFSWGELGRFFQRFPRVVCDGTILAKAMWVFQEASIKALISDMKKAGKAALDTWRQEHEIPRQIFWTENDQDLLIDFDNTLSIETFISLSKNKSQIILHENLCLDYLPKVTNEQNEHCRHEVLWFYSKQEKASKEGATDRLKLYAHVEKNLTQRDFIPGSEWTYIKIYCGQNASTKILQEVVLPLINQFKSSIDKWFFIRYFDEGYHIRFRVKWQTGTENEQFLHEMYKWVEKKHLRKEIHKIILDTYSRELERYDPAIINEVETLFCNSSELVLTLYDMELPALQTKLSAFKYIDSLLNKFAVGIEERESMLGHLAAGFGHEFRIDKNMKKRLSGEFRSISHKIDHIIDSNTPLGQTIDGFIALNSEDISKILYEKSQGRLLKPLASILSSIIHMFINRLYTSDQRYWEMQIYQLMHRYYRQKSHWSKKNALKNEAIKEGIKSPENVTPIIS